MNQYRPNRIHRMTVLASSPDEARVVAQIRNPDFGPTVPGGVRLVGRLEPEQADGMTQAKAREFVEWRGCEVKVTG